MRIGKYKFNNEAQAISKIDALEENHNHTIVKLGLEKLTDAVIDVDGVVTVDATYSDAYLVDALWANGVEPYGWKSYRADIKGEGKHTFLGVKYQDNKI